MVSRFGTETSPSSGASSPVIIRKSVVLPEPFGPDEADLVARVQLERGVDEEDLAAVLLADARKRNHGKRTSVARDLDDPPDLPDPTTRPTRSTCPTRILCPCASPRVHHLRPQRELRGRQGAVPVAAHGDSLRASRDARRTAASSAPDDARRSARRSTASPLDAIRAASVRRHLRGPVLLRRAPARAVRAATTSPAACTPRAAATTST